MMTLSPRWRGAASVPLGALLLAWPALLNGYPAVFSDTGGFVEMAFLPDGGWDKPWIYPALLLFGAGITLWVPLALQCLALSHLLRLLAPRKHVALCALLALGTAAPWFASLMMPDVFAPVAVLCVALLALRAHGRGTRAWLVLLGAFAIASHLAHLIVAAACVLAAWLATRRVALLPAAPLGLALLALLLANGVALHRLGVSPYGSVFALARLAADGPAADTLRERCPAAGWRLCRWVGRLPADSDDFLWGPEGPIWGGGFGPTRAAPEAAAIVAATLRDHPLAVLRAALLNALRQLGRVRVGDAFGPQHLPIAVGTRLARFFGPAEHARFASSRQAAGALEPVAARFARLHAVLLVLGALGSVALLPTRERGLALVVLAGVLANAAATGALSGPHDRYGARVAWLVVLPPALLLTRRGPRPRPASSAPSSRTRAAAFP